MLRRWMRGYWERWWSLDNFVTQVIFQSLLWGSFILLHGTPW